MHVPASTNETTPDDESTVHTEVVELEYVFVPEPADAVAAIVGGVAANSRLRERLESEWKFWGLELAPSFPLRDYCTDNAAMVAAAAYHRLVEVGPSPLDTGALRASGMAHPPEVSGTKVTVRLTFGGAAAPYALFVHENLRSIVVQQEVSTDTLSFRAALRHVLRQDPDVVGIGEMRDLETIAAVLNARTRFLVSCLVLASGCALHHAPTPAPGDDAPRHAATGEMT